MASAKRRVLRLTPKSPSPVILSVEEFICQHRPGPELVPELVPDPSGLPSPDTEVTLAETTPVKRGRGRPRKAPVMGVEGTEIVEMVVLEEVSQVAEASSDIAAVAETYARPRRRRRYGSEVWSWDDVVW